jgi:transposase InsO family protein
VAERLRILWLMEYFQISQRRLSKAVGVSRSSVQRWLKALQDGDLGKRQRPREPVNRTPREIAALIWEIFKQNPLWGRHRIAMTTWGLGVFVAASTVRDILKRPRPCRVSAHVGVAKQPEAQPRQIVARYPNHVWSVDRTRVWRWRVWPTWTLVAVDHCSRMVTTACALAGPNAAWVADALELAFVRHGVPKYIITDQEGVFAGSAFAELLSKWGPKQRFGAVGKHGSIAVTERAILTLKHEWLGRVPLISSLDHLERLLSDFTEYYNGWRGHMTLGGALPCTIYQGYAWRRPDRTSKTLSGPIERRLFADTRVTAFRLSTYSGFTGG